MFKATFLLGAAVVYSVLRLVLIFEKKKINMFVFPLLSRLFTIKPKYLHTEISLRLLSRNQTARLYKIHVTALFAALILSL